MDLKTHKQTLNERLIVLIHDLNEQFSNDVELPEVIRDLTRVSKFLIKNELKKFENENKNQRST